ncbi:MarR family winged helix-turn-helix transcriptional regulator [Chakrabartyella piscis]|uniref:MarR family winged helix-turn-helix transcriptional regulator n=1 Tax=Chakrabartyella piscis TaxID=2918914 RepID=UPI00295889D7|nr:MarR family transcriptional regulator [Chakrabartyella piscis]
MDMKELFHTISLKRKFYFDDLLEELDLNFMELEVLDFLNHEPNRNTFTEIIKSKGYAKSHISSAISNLIDKGYLAKEPAPNNKKVFYLRLLEKSEYALMQQEICIKNYQKTAFRGITKEELDTFQTVLMKIESNLTEE